MSNRYFVKDIGKAKSRTERSCRNCKHQDRPLMTPRERDEIATGCFGCLMPDKTSDYRGGWTPRGA